ncbi:MAG: glycosyltransferase family 4 protein [Eubacteriales bacterium]|nr:glycosyltransferase family 4 protein [Eubacteriales bacterium]
MKPNILIANQSTGCLTVDVVNEFNRCGKYDKTELFAGVINIRPSRPDKEVLITKTMKYNNKSFSKRFISWTISFFHLIIHLALKNNSTELFLITNPPFNTFVPFFSRKKYSILIYDIYPDTLISQKIISRQSVIAKFWTWANKRVFSNAEDVFTISNEMKKIVGQHVNESKIKVVYNWTHNEHMVPVEKQNNSFLKDLNLQDKFIVLYSGNMGYTHDIDALVDVANELKGESSIHFLFIGEGGKKKVVESKIINYGLKNCTVLPYQPNEIIPFSIGSADIGVVTTSSEQTGLSIPSKVNALMSVGAALLCLTSEDSELGNLVVENNVGRRFDKNEILQMARYIKTVYTDRDYQNLLKANSRKTSFKFTPDNAKLFLK